ncbi:MAG TPA: ABC transporter ATP-binding protein [Clostridiaceae bacterium]|nr:ABC transporter ATP-binding protein [Clostridiaceae bacterium]
MIILKVDNLSKKYPGFLLDDISFSISEGKIMGLIGKNGAGKSTTLKGMLNLVNRDGGMVEMFGMDFFKHEEEIKQQLGVVLGGIDFYNHKRLSDITAVTKRFYNNWDDDAYENYMDVFSLNPNKKVKELSSGMKVKYMLTLALSHNAKLLILDEPTSGLDPVARDDLLTLFRQLVEKKNITVLFSTHIITDLEKCADYITYIKDGKLLKSAEKDEFIDSFQYLREPDENTRLSLEDIMIRTERREYNV